MYAALPLLKRLREWRDCFKKMTPGILDKELNPWTLGHKLGTLPLGQLNSLIWREMNISKSNGKFLNFELIMSLQFTICRSASLCSGDLHPDTVLKKERLLKANKKAYYSELQNYHCEYGNWSFSSFLLPSIVFNHFIIFFTFSQYDQGSTDSESKMVTSESWKCYWAKFLEVDELYYLLCIEFNDLCYSRICMWL